MLQVKVNIERRCICHCLCHHHHNRCWLMFATGTDRGVCRDKTSSACFHPRSPLSITLLFWDKEKQDDNDDDLYIMVKCVSVCNEKVTKFALLNFIYLLIFLKLFFGCFCWFLFLFFCLQIFLNFFSSDLDGDFDDYDCDNGDNLMVMMVMRTNNCYSIIRMVINMFFLSSIVDPVGKVH